MLFTDQQLLPLPEERNSEISFALSSGKMWNMFTAYANNEILNFLLKNSADSIGHGQCSDSRIYIYIYIYRVFHDFTA